MNLLVTGATGVVGSRLVPVLADRGHAVTVLTRDAAGYDAPAGVRVAEGDLLAPGSFEGALEGVDAAYYLVHSMGAGGDFAERDRRAAHNFARAASSAGVDRVVYLGGLGDRSEGLSPHLRSRREVERALAEGTYDLTTLRAAVVVAAGSASFELIRRAVESLPPVGTVVGPRGLATECQPIALADVSAYLAGVLDVPETAGEVFEIGGPEVLTYGELLERTARATGRRVRVRASPFPLLAPGLAALTVDLFGDVPASVAGPLLEGLGTRVVAEDNRIRRLVPVELTPLDVAIERAV